MAKFKIGDRVKFLSSEGGGVIRSFASTNVANVEDESGFEIPTLVSELILDYCEDKAGAFFCSKDPAAQYERQNEQEETISPTSYPSDERISKLFLNRRRNQTSEGLYLCFVPQEQKWLVYGDVDIYLVNYTTHRVIYSIYLSEEERGFVLEDYGTLEKEEKILLNTVTREQLEAWKKSCAQLIFADDETQNVLLPVNCEIKVRTNRFYTEGSFTENAFFSDKAIIYPLCTMISVGTFLQAAPAKNTEPNEKTEPQIIAQTNSSCANTFLSKHMTGKTTAEVDLHIEELVEDAATLSPEQMLKTQLSYATKCLNEAILQGVNKIVFIHGVGQGVLKKELCKELDKYKGTHYFDAPMSRYGVGATEVYISTNKAK